MARAQRSWARAYWTPRVLTRRSPRYANGVVARRRRSGMRWRGRKGVVRVESLPAASGRRPSQQRCNQALRLLTESRELLFGQQSAPFQGRQFSPNVGIAESQNRTLAPGPENRRRRRRAVAGGLGIGCDVGAGSQKYDSARRGGQRGLGRSCFCVGHEPSDRRHFRSGAGAANAASGRDSEPQRGRGQNRGGARGRLRGALVVAEIALALTLAVGAWLLLRTFANLRRVDKGFDSRDTLTFYISPRGKSYDTVAKMNDLYRRALERLRSLPGVESAALTNRKFNTKSQRVKESKKSSGFFPANL